MIVWLGCARAPGLLAATFSFFSMHFPFLTICSFTFVALSSFSRGKDTEISREGKTNTGFSHGKGTHTHTDFAFILLHVSVHMHCFVTASDSECRSSEAVFLTAHMFVKVLSALASDREFFQAILSLAFALAFR